MRSLSVRLLLSLLVLVLAPAAFAHDITITGTQTFASLDGSSSDHDGVANGVFTVSDGNLVVNGVVNCNDDGASPDACAMAFAVSGNMTINSGGALYAENRGGSGNGAAITLTVGGNLALNGTAIVSSASRTSSGSNGGAITANVSGSVTLAAGTTIDSGASNARGGNLTIAAGGVVSVDGNVLSGPSRTILSTRLTDLALDGGTGNSIGGAITIGTSSFAGPALSVGANANIISQGSDGGAGPVKLDGCGIEIRGLVAALARKDSAAQVSIRSGKNVVIDGRDLGGSGTRMGRLRGDAPSGTGAGKGVDVFAAETIDLLGPAGSLFVITAHPGTHDSKSVGGLIRVLSLGAGVNASGNVIDSGRTASGDTGGTIEVSAKNDVTLNTAVVRAVGDSSTNNSNRGGGSIRVRSYSGNVLWTNGTGDVRPVGSASGLAPADQGSIVLTACGTVNTTGSSFPANGTPTSPLPATTTGACSPAAPSLPSGVPALITCNTPPVANDTSATTNEDTTVTITLSGTDADGDSLTFTVISGPLHGSVGTVISTGPTTATVDYTPALNYNGSDSFVFRANDGNGGTDDATVTITVVPVNDPPTFVIGAPVTVLEDSGPVTITNWITAISPGPADESGQSVTFTVTTTNPALFSVQPAVAPNGTLTFTPAANMFGGAAISVTAQDSGGTANGGNDTSAPQGSNINVTPVNDEPSFVKGADQTVNEDAGPQTVSPWATAISAGPNESGQTLTFVTSNNNNALFSAQPAVSAGGTLTYTPAANANGSALVSVYLTDNGGIANGGDDTSPTQTFTITVNSVNDAPSFTGGGNVTVNEDSGAYSASWATSISAGPANESSQTVSFNVSNDNNSLFSAQPAINASGLLTFTPAANAFGTATVTVTAQDNGGTLNGGVDTSAAQTFTITVNAVNDEPSFTPGGNQTVNEDAGAQSVAWATAISAGPANESSQTVTFHTSNDNNALFSSQPSIASNGTLTYTPAANANGTATVTVYATDDGGIANGGDDTSPTYTFTITVNPVNDAPSFTGGGNVTVNEDSGAYSAAWATAISAGPADESGQTLTFNIVSNSNPALFASGPSVSASGVLAFTPAANAFGSATIVINLQDNGGGSDTSSNYTFTITVNPVNDAPSFTSGGDVTVNEDSGPYSAAWASAISPGPNESGQLVNFVVTNSNNSLFSSQPSISPTGVLTFTPAPNASGSVTVSVTLHDNGGTANGGVDNSPTVQFTITINGVNDAPTASNDTWETLGNTEIRVDLAGGTTPKIVDTTGSGNGVRDNDSDPEGDPFAVTGIVGCSDVIAPFDCTFGDGAKVSMNANGSFSYTPGPGNPIGSFQYQITDTPAAGSPATSIGTVTFTIYDRIWYVNGSAAPGGNGTSSAPFDSFASLSGGSDVDVPGDTIFIHNSLVSGSLAAEANQKIWGEGVGLSTNQNLNGNGTPQVLVAAGVRPQVSSSTDVITVTGVTGVDIAGISLSSATGAGVLVTSTVGFPAAGATIRENVVTSAGGAGIDVNADSALGTTVHVTNTSITSTGNGFDVNGSGPSVVSYNGGTILSASGNGIWLDGSGSGGNLTVTGLSNVTIDGTTAAQGIHADAVKFDATAGGSFDTVNGGTIVIGSAGNPVGTAGVSLTSVSGDFAIGSLTVFGGTSGVTVGGSGLFTGAAGMRITNGAGSISAPAGVGLSVTNATIGASGVKFTSISSNGAVNGIVLNNTGSSGSLTVQGTGSAASGGTIQNTSSHGVMLTSTLAPSFNNLSVQSTFGSGVKGTQVTGFSFTNGAINNSGTGLGVDESNIAFNTTAAGTENNLSGVVTITGNTLSTAYYHGVDIFNFNGTISNANISNNTITSTASTATSKGSGIRLIAFGSASTVANVTKAAITGNTVSNFPSAAGIMAQGGNGNAAGSPGTFGVAGSGTNVIAITGNFVAGASAANRLGTQAILAVVNGRGQGNFDISSNGTAGNPIRDMIGNAISLSSLGFANVTASVNNNVIAANNLLASAGIAAGTSRTFTGADTPSLTVSIVGNSVSQVNGNGILVTARDATGTLHADVRNNIVAAPTSGIRPGIRADAGNALSIDDAMCLKISGNTSAGSGGSQGIGLRKQGAVTTTNDFGVDGMSATSSPGVESYVDSQNPAGNGTLLISATSGFSNCTF